MSSSLQQAQTGIEVTNWKLSLLQPNMQPALFPRMASQLGSRAHCQVGAVMMQGGQGRAECDQRGRGKLLATAGILGKDTTAPHSQGVEEEG